jgi:putative ABC transport system substrate-binding protein
VKRRDFIRLLGGAAAAWPLATRAQQAVMPVVGFLGGGSSNAFAAAVAGFRRGLNEIGIVEGKTAAIEYRWAEGRYDRLPALADELVRWPVATILASGGELPTRAAMAATSTIPIVFTYVGDPVAAGLVASLNRPGGNVTGVNFFAAEAVTKQLGLLREVVPAATIIAVLVNPATDVVSKELQAGAQSAGMQLRVLGVSAQHEIDETFASFAQHRPDALLIQAEPFIVGQYSQIASLAMRHMIPTISASRGFATAGGLMSYGASAPDAYRQAGIYVGRILQGKKPADLPVVQSTRFELVINVKTAKALGIAPPPTLLALADEVIE